VLSVMAASPLSADQLEAQLLEGTGGGCSPTLLGEGAYWDTEKQVLYHLDIVTGKIFVYCPVAKRNTHKIDLRIPIGAIVRRASKQADVWQVVAATSRGFVVVDIPSGKIVEFLANPESDIPTNRMNDGKCDPQGRFWCGSTDVHCQKGLGFLYSLDADKQVTKHLSGCSIPNGIVWNLAGDTMYWTDTGDNAIYAFDFDGATGKITNRRVALLLPSDPADPKFVGYIDGTTLDAEGKLWAAMWCGYGVRRYDLATGECLMYIRVAAKQTTSCAFGGPNLDQLFITSASCGLSQADRVETPLSGHVFHADLSSFGIKGLPAVAYQG